MNPTQIYTLIVIIAVIMILVFGEKLLRMCFHSPENVTIGKTKFSYPAQSQYEYLRTITIRFKDQTEQLAKMIIQAQQMDWKKERLNRPVCSDKYYRITIPGKDTHGSDFGTLYKRKD